MDISGMRVVAGDPVPGWYRMRLVRHGPWVPARIGFEHPLDFDTGTEDLSSAPVWHTFIDGKLVREPNADPAIAGVFRVWMHGEPISETEYLYMVANADYARKHAPSEPQARPKEPIDFTKVDAEFFAPRRK